jgi:hypothetical protein
MARDDEFLARAVAALPIFDVHEHHMPEVFLAREVGLLDLIDQSYAGWTLARPYPLEGEVLAPRVGPSRDAAADEERILRLISESSANSFFRNLDDACVRLHGLPIAASTWRELDAEIRRRHADPAWTGQVLESAGVARVITDPFSAPLLDARKALGPRYLSVLRINALTFGYHPDARDHNGNSAHEFAAELGARLETFDDFADFLEQIVATMPSRGQVAIKNALAYDRDVAFGEPDESSARLAWGDPSPSKERVRAFSDWTVDRLATIAGERDVPVQMHLGTARIRGSAPLLAARLIERHPRTRFLLMHLAYPWSSELLAMAFVYRNVWIDLTWSFLLSPTHAKRALHEAIEILPDASRLMLGGDNWHAEETWATLRRARGVVGGVLSEKVRDGWLEPALAVDLARRIFYENAARFFAVEGPAS